jgi:hypothetical protein
MRKSRIILCLALAIPVILAVLWATLRQAPTFNASVSFSGYHTNADGSRVPTFTVTNRGNTTIRRWDFCQVESKPAVSPAEIHLGPDAYLKPGQSEVIVLPAPVTQPVWRITLYFTHTDWREMANEAASQSQVVGSVIPEKFRDLPVDHQVQSDWIGE